MTYGIIGAADLIFTMDGEEDVRETSGEEDDREESCEITSQDECNKGVKRKSDFQVVYCSICKVSLNSSSQATAHYSGKSHQNKVRSQTSTLDTMETSTAASDPVSNPAPESLKCELCYRSFNSESQMNAHLTGKAHQLLAKSKLDSFDITASPATNDTATAEPKEVLTSLGSNLSKVFHCAMCNITLNSQKQMEQHNKGLRHKIVIGKAKPPAVAGEKWENVRFMKITNAVLGTNKDSVTGSGGGMNLRQFYCEKCDITVNSQIQLDQHLESQKHKMKGIESTSNWPNKRKRSGATGYGGHLAGQGYQFTYNKQPNYGARYKVTKPYLPPLSSNFIRSSNPIFDSGMYSDNENLHIMGQFGAEDVSQNWNSNFIYDVPPQNLAMF